MKRIKLLSYSEALKMGKEKLRAALIPIKVMKAKQQAKLEMCKLDEQIAVKTDDLHTVCSKDDVRFSKIIDLQDDLMLLIRRKDQYQTILDEMFPENASESDGS